MGFPFWGFWPSPSIYLYYYYGDVVYDGAFNESFHKNLESIQYSAVVAITGATRGTSSDKLSQELGLESLKLRRWLRKLCLFYEIFHEKSPSYLFQLIPPNNNVYATRSSQSNKISSFKTRHNFFKDSFFPAVISEWNSLDINIFGILLLLMCLRKNYWNL